MPPIPKVSTMAPSLQGNGPTLAVGFSQQVGLQLGLQGESSWSLWQWERADIAGEGVAELGLAVLFPGRRAMQTSQHRRLVSRKFAWWSGSGTLN